MAREALYGLQKAGGPKDINDAVSEAYETKIRNDDPLYRGAVGILSNNTDASNAYEYGGEQGRALQDLKMLQSHAKAGLNRQAVQLDLNRDYALRGQQVGLAGAYANQMNGGGPSTANIQLARGLDSAAAQAGMARAASPMNLAAAQRGGIVGSGAAGQAAAVAGANQRATEISNARMGLAGVGSQMTGRDMGNVVNQGKLEMQQRALNDQYFNRNEDLGQEVMRLQTQGQQARSEGIASYQKMMRQKQLGAQKQADAVNDEYTNMALGTAKGLASVVGLSDERYKREINDAGRELEKFLASFEPKSFKYTPDSGEDSSRARYGVLAQDLEKSKVGASVVREVDGKKYLDVPAVSGLALATVANLNARLKKLESKKR